MQFSAGFWHPAAMVAQLRMFLQPEGGGQEKALQDLLETSLLKRVLLVSLALSSSLNDSPIALETSTAQQTRGLEEFVLQHTGMRHRHHTSRTALLLAHAHY